jgi:hypothetical protein
MKIDPPLGPSRRDRLAQILVSVGGTRKSLTRTLVVVEIQMAPMEALSHRSARKNPH